jgi:CDP-diacylglycerol--serine O-phosphatidyltransferase
MVSKVALINLKFKNYSFKENTSRYILLLVSILSIIILGWLSAFAILFSYILVSLLFKKELK